MSPVGSGLLSPSTKWSTAFVSHFFVLSAKCLLGLLAVKVDKRSKTVFSGPWDHWGWVFSCLSLMSSLCWWRYSSFGWRCLAVPTWLDVLTKTVPRSEVSVAAYCRDLEPEEVHYYNIWPHQFASSRCQGMRGLRHVCPAVRTSTVYLSFTMRINIPIVPLASQSVLHFDFNFDLHNPLSQYADKSFHFLD